MEEQRHSRRPHSRSACRSVRRFRRRSGAGPLQRKGAGHAKKRKAAPKAHYGIVVGRAVLARRRRAVRVARHFRLDAAIQMAGIPLRCACNGNRRARIQLHLAL